MLALENMVSYGLTLYMTLATDSVVNTSSLVTHTQARVRRHALTRKALEVSEFRAQLQYTRVNTWQ
jgi:hypothetical protein